MPTITRSCLTVPGDDADLVGKALSAGADEVVVDLEDAVPPAGKPAARDTALTRLTAAAATSDGPRRVLRVNALGTQWVLDDLLAAADLDDDVLHGVVLPKVEGPEDVRLATQVMVHRRLAGGREPTHPPLGVLVETAAGLATLDATLAVPGVDHVLLGFGDLAASLGMPTTEIGDDPRDADTWHAVRTRVLVAARSVGVRALDGPYADHRDTPGLMRSAGRAHLLGFDGKWAIHPAQVAPIHEVFAVTDEEIAEAEAVLAALDEAAAQGRGSASLDGRMIDEASRTLATQRLALAAAARADRTGTG